MSEHTYVEYLYADGESAELLTPIHDRLAATSDGSIVGDVDPASRDNFAYTAETSAGDVTVWISYERPGEDEWFDWPRIELRCSAGSLTDDEFEVDSPLAQMLIDIARMVYLATEIRPERVYGCSMFQGFTEPPVADASLRAPRPYLTWLDVFTPAEVDAIGREKLMSAPAPRVEELDDGAILVCSSHPASQNSGQLEAVADHLGIPDWLEYIE